MSQSGDIDDLDEGDRIVIATSMRQWNATFCRYELINGVWWFTFIPDFGFETALEAGLVKWIEKVRVLT